jgi:hypothetical protein
VVKAVRTLPPKDDADKPQIWRGALDYFPLALIAVARVSEVGTRAPGHEWGGWRDVPDGARRYTEAMVRHLMAESTEGPYDLTDNQLHAAKVAWGALCRLELMLREKRVDAAPGA